LAERISVLIVDDHFIVRKGLLALLAECGDVLVVGEAADGREAVDRAAELAPDVVLMDILMPVLDGVAATRAILERRPATRIVALTGIADSEKVIEMIRAGALGYLAKSTTAGRSARAATSSPCRARSWSCAEQRSRSPARRTAAAPQRE